MLFPWVPPPVPDADHKQLAGYAASLEPFSFRLTRVEWFGEVVVWLSPEPDERFRDMTRSIFEMWPDHPPYGGDHDDPTPHLTIGEGGERDAMRSVAALAAELVPIEARATEISLMHGSVDSTGWEVAAKFPLGV